MKKFIIISIMFLICIFAYSQETMKDLNFIIVIDDEIIEGGIICFSVHDKAGNIYSAYYSPGNLSISQSDYHKMMSEDNNKTLFLSFTYDSYQGTNNNIYTYNIELSKMYFKEYYNIVEIYNLDKKIQESI